MSTSTFAAGLNTTVCSIDIGSCSRREVTNFGSKYTQVIASCGGYRVQDFTTDVMPNTISLVVLGPNQFHLAVDLPEPSREQLSRVSMRLKDVGELHIVCSSKSKIGQ